MSEQSVASNAESPRLGQRLQQARQALGWSHAEVAAKLKLSPRQIEAMEEEDWASLPESPYARGFYRNYARLVGIDPATLQFDTAVGAPTNHDSQGRLELPTQDLGTVPHERESKPHKASSWLIPAILLLALAAGVAYLQSMEEPQPRPTAVSGPSPAPATAPAASAAEPVTGAASTPATANTAAAEAKPSEVATPSAQRRIRLVFEGKSWTEIRSNGEIVFSETAAPGVREFDAPAPLSFVIGNASLVKLEVDGKPYDFSSSIRNEVARFQIP